METNLTIKVDKALEKSPQDLNNEEIIILVNQGRNLELVIPIATLKIKECVFAEGESGFAGILLSLLNVNPSFWTSHQDLYWDLYDSISYVMPIVERLAGLYPKFERITDQLGASKE